MRNEIMDMWRRGGVISEMVCRWNSSDTEYAGDTLMLGADGG